MQRRNIAQTLADALFETETAVDTALEKAALLIAQTSSLRRAHSFSAVLGHEGVAAITRAVEALGQARGHTMTAHTAFADAAPNIGVKPATLQGTGLSKPESNPVRPTASIPAPRLLNEA
jgi:hypothetical protein